MPTPTNPRQRAPITTAARRVFLGVKIAPENASKLRQRARREHKGNVSATVDAMIAESKTGGPASAPSTGHQRQPARPRTSPVGRHAAK